MESCEQRDQISRRTVNRIQENFFLSQKQVSHYKDHFISLLGVNGARKGFIGIMNSGNKRFLAMNQILK